VIEKPRRIDLGPLKLPSHKEKINVREDIWQFEVTHYKTLLFIILY